MDHLKYDVAIRVFAKQAKANRRELLVYKAFAELLKSNGFAKTVEALLDEARHSTDVQTYADEYDKAIDARIPPSDADRLDEAIQKVLAALPSAGLPN